MALGAVSYEMATAPKTALRYRSVHAPDISNMTETPSTAPSRRSRDSARRETSDQIGMLWKGVHQGRA
ncbi:hypothetical protein ABUR84_14560, partial [Staphylococcus aureus]